MSTNRFCWILTLVTLGILLTVACAPTAPEAPPVQAEEAEHMEAVGHGHAPDDHMAGAHDVPEEEAAVPNPIRASHDNIEAGEKLYSTNCAVCHGETGQGDGPGAAGLQKPPADLNAGHVQGLSDGALFYIISHGRPDTPMPAWDNILPETDRWQVVTFLRTFDDGEPTAHDDEAEHDDEGEHNEEAEEEHHEDDDHEDQQGDDHDD